MVTKIILTIAVGLFMCCYFGTLLVYVPLHARIINYFVIELPIFYWLNYLIWDDYWIFIGAFVNSIM